MAGSLSSNPRVTRSPSEDFMDRTTRRWCDAHPRRENLQAVVVEVHFRPEPPLFTEGEGAVVAPLAIELAGAQHVIDIASEPAHLRTLTADGITAAAWEYSGRLHRGMRFVGAALVERAPFSRAVLPEKPTFAGLPSDLRAEALARAADLEEHGLHQCPAFAEWARREAGNPPHPDQILRLVRATAPQSEGNVPGADDVCAAVRKRGFTPHWAQVAVVMAARELGIPAFGFASASDRRIYLVGTYVDRLGWILVDVERGEDGWFSGGPPLITRAPLLGRFAAAPHGFWYPQGAAYHNSDWGGVSRLSGTVWYGRLTADQKVTDTTEARSFPLAEVCR
jgi:hypothetical protein